MKIEDLILLMEAVNKNKIDEFKYRNEAGEKILIRKGSILTAGTGSQPQVVLSQAAQTPVQREEEIPADLHSDLVITSPLVGTFYLSPSPGAEPFVKVGDRVLKGQVVGIIEAMKLMNEVESEFDGVIEEILIGDEEVVEFGQPLFRIR